MQTQQIISAANGTYFFGTANAGSAEKTLDNTFEKMFQASSEKYDTVSVKESKNIVVEKNSVSSEAKESNTAEETQVSKETKKDVEPVGAAKQSENVDEKELAECVAEVLSQVTQVVKDVLNLTSEQLKETMNLLGITEVDLLNADALKQMVLAVNGEQDAAAFLMNGDLLSQMQQLLGEVETLLEESGLNPETFSEIFENDKFSELLEQAMDELVEAGTNKTASEETQTGQMETVTVKETEITFRAEASETKADVADGGDRKDTGSNEELLQDDAALSNQFLQNLQKAVTEGLKETTFGTSLAEQIREIANQILEQVKVVVAPEMTSLEIQLTPEHLGKVNITVTEQDGVMKASFVTDNELAKEAIESNLIQFKQMMNEQGIRVESIEVTVSEFTFDKNGEANQSRQEEKKQNKAHFIVEEEANTVSMQDELALHFMEGGESTVNYMA